MDGFKRKKFLTKKQYQIKYTVVIVAAVLIAAAAVMAALYRDVAAARPELASEVLVWEKYLIRTGIVTVFAILFGVFLSHKIIGPVFRLTETLSRINRGDFKARIKLRKGDEFLKLGEEINSLSGKLEKLSEEDPDLKEKFTQL